MRNIMEDLIRAYEEQKRKRPGGESSKGKRRDDEDEDDDDDDEEERDSDDDDDDDDDSSTEDNEKSHPKKKSKRSTAPQREIPLEVISKPIHTIRDLIDLGKTYNPRLRKRYNIDLAALSRMVDSLTDLDEMIGMEKVKTHIVGQILYFLQGLNDGKLDMLHTVIQGPPGVGKTVLGRLLSRIYLDMGVLRSNRFVIARRSDLVGKYLGHTADKTQKVIDRARGGVLFIDEAYSLGDADGRDSFSKECIDTLNQNLTENKAHFMCIIAGYEDALNTCFFAQNPGLERRFNFRFTIDPYTPQNLMEIFRKLVKDIDWSCATELDQKLFETNAKNFKNYGGDMETLLFLSKIAHGRRVFGKEAALQRVLSTEDIATGVKDLLKMREPLKKAMVPYPGMYV